MCELSHIHSLIVEEVEGLPLSWYTVWSYNIRIPTDLGSLLGRESAFFACSKHVSGKGVIQKLLI